MKDKTNASIRRGGDVAATRRGRRDGALRV